MRLLLINYEFPPIGGGASAACYHMAKELVAHGHEVDVLTSRWKEDRKDEKIDGVMVHRVSSTRQGIHACGMLGAFTFCLFASQRLRTLVRDREFDCAHFFFALPTGALAPWWKYLTRKPYIISLRGSDVPGYDRVKKLALMHRILRPFTRSVMSGAFRVAANSRSLRSLAQQTFPTIPIDVITNGVCTQNFRPKPTRIANGNPRLLCVARLVNRKGLQELVEAMAHPALVNCSLSIVGEGPLLFTLQTQIQDLGLENRIQLVGHLYGSGLQEAYRNADCFILPSLSESFSMALLEAMASGLPVVATRIGGIPELVEDEVNGRLVAPSDASELALGITWMISDRERMQNIGASNRDKICMGYSWQRIVASYENRCYIPACHGSITQDALQ